MDNLNKKDHQKSDFIELCNLMKDELDKINVTKKKVVFDLDLCYDKLYKLQMLNRFYTPRDLFDVGTTDSSFQETPYYF